MIRPEMLRTPEDGLGLETRVTESLAPDPEPEEEPGLEKAPALAGPSVHERIAAARRLVARPEEGCRDCWTHGRDAALAAVGDMVDGQELPGRLRVARTIVPSGSELHWRACWERGRDAALRTIEGK